MIEIEINNKKYNLPKEVVEYIYELEYYHNYVIGRRVIEIHSGMTGYILFMFNDYYSIPKEIFPANDDYFEILGDLVVESHKKLQWFIIKSEVVDKIYAFPFVFLRMMPPLEDSEEIEEDDSGEMISDN
jgi:hypothetical protein